MGQITSTRGYQPEYDIKLSGDGDPGGLHRGHDSQRRLVESDIRDILINANVNHALLPEAWSRSVKWMLRDNVKVEVKDNRVAKRTGRLFIEVAKKDAITGELVASGLPLSEADVYTIRIGPGVALHIEKWRLEYLVNCERARSGLRYGGDNNRFAGVLVSIMDLITLDVPTQAMAA
jgi:hypothetical protein